MSKILVIGDAHIEENDSLERFKNLSKLIIKEKPEEIIIIGDFLSCDAFSEFDKNKKKVMEGKRFKNEIIKGNEALNLIDSAIKKSKHVCKKIYIEGNHEDRVERYINYNPTFDGIINIDILLDLKNKGWEFIRYKTNYYSNNISFTHIPIAANGKPLGGDFITKKALQIFNNHVVFGHTHRLEISSVSRYIDNKPKQVYSINVGCFFEHSHQYQMRNNRKLF